MKENVQPSSKTTKKSVHNSFRAESNDIKKDGKNILKKNCEVLKLMELNSDTDESYCFLNFTNCIPDKEGLSPQKEGSEQNHGNVIETFGSPIEESEIKRAVPCSPELKDEYGNDVYKLCERISLTVEKLPIYLTLSGRKLISMIIIP